MKLEELNESVSPLIKKITDQMIGDLEELAERLRGDMLGQGTNNYTPTPFFSLSTVTNPPK